MFVVDPRHWSPGDWVFRDSAGLYFILDVFTDTPLTGNQLGVFPFGNALADEDMQRIARELNLSETVFVLTPGESEDAYVRIFTPLEELPFAGHPVLGTAILLGRLLDQDTVHLRTGSGTVPVVIERGDLGCDFGWMEQPLPSWTPYEECEALLAALALETSALPVEAYRNGPTHVYVGLRTEDDVAALRPDLAALAELSVCVNSFAGSNTSWKMRMFAPALGVPEDPATGSAAGPLAVHLGRHGKIDFGQEIRIRQGEEIGRPSLLYARAEGSATRLKRVQVGGSALVVAKGRYRLA